VGGNSPHGDHPLSIPMIAVTGGTSPVPEMPSAPGRES
jgi:hypothetical protein